jgi:hypothetical protein
MPKYSIPKPSKMYQNWYFWYANIHMYPLATLILMLVVRWVQRNGEEPALPGLPYTQKQLFFISFGQVWCSKYRDKVSADGRIPG